VWEGRDVYRVLVGKPEGRRPLGRSWRRWEDNIRMDLQKVGCGCVDWMELAGVWTGWSWLVCGLDGAGWCVDWMELAGVWTGWS
jgi:hypothetical protein